MPNTTSAQTVHPAAPRRRWRRNLALVLLAGVVVAIALIWQPLQRYAVTGASYGARVACSCRYLGGRSLADCHKDMEGPVAWVSLSENAATQSVTARYPLISGQTATFRPGWGCQLQPWTGSAP